MSANAGDGPADGRLVGNAPSQSSSRETGAVVSVAVTGLDFVAAGVSVMVPRRNLLADGDRIVLTDTPIVRRAVDVPGLQQLIDVAFAAADPVDKSTPTDQPSPGGPGPPRVAEDPTAPIAIVRESTRVDADDLPLIEVCAESTIHADDLHAGDVIDYCGHLHHLTRVDRGEGWSWPVACDGTGWAMALGHDLVILHRRAG